MAERRRRRKRAPGDGLEQDFGPGFDPTEEPPVDTEAAGQAPDAGSRIPCGKDGCLLKPIGDLAARFALELARRGHSESAARAVTSGIELLKALRDFLDEEIALAERAAEARRTAGRYTKIPVE
jgi:hypothetical protein